MHKLAPLSQPLPSRPAGSVSILIAGELQLVGAEPAARAVLIRHAHVIGLRQGRLHLPQQQAALEAAVAALLTVDAPSALALALHQDTQLLLTMKLHRDRAARPQRVWVHLVDAAAPQLDPTLLGGMFGLTTAEVRVALLLAQGLSAEDIASRQRVQPNTVRSHIKQVLTKTQTRRQAQLVALLWRTAAVVHPSPDDAVTVSPASGG